MLMVGIGRDLVGLDGALGGGEGALIGAGIGTIDEGDDCWHLFMGIPVKSSHICFFSASQSSILAPNMGASSSPHTGSKYICMAAPGCLRLPQAELHIYMHEWLWIHVCSPTN